jgi:hypothetical protein
MVRKAGAGLNPLTTSGLVHLWSVKPILAYKEKRRNAELA